MTLARIIAGGFGAGAAPRAPGTAGSLLGLLVGTLLLAGGHFLLLAGIIIASVAGIWSIRASAQGAKDPGWIVIDEIAGQMIALLALRQVSPAGLALAFILFRLFDITKPGPVGWADARHDEWGVMGDDWIAGCFAALCIALLRAIVPGHPL